MARTTLVIPDSIWREVKQRAAKENRNISEWVSDAIQSKIKPTGKTSTAKNKFEDFWVTKPLGGLSYPLTRDWIYDDPGKD